MTRVNVRRCTLKYLFGVIMSYEEFIQNIINTRGQWSISAEEYYEVHHIVPKCLGGLPKYPSRKSKHPNLIYLLPEEHYEAHKLLVEKYPDNRQLIAAFWLMSNNLSTGQTISQQDYALARRLKQEAMQGELNSFYGKRHSEETKAIIREKARERSLGRPGTNNRQVICINTGIIYDSATAAGKEIGATHTSILDCCYGKTNRAKGYYFAFVEDIERQERFAKYQGTPPSKADTEETRQKRSAASKGRTWTEESRHKLSEALKGKKKSPESIKKMKQTKALNKYEMTEDARKRASAKCKHKKKVLCVELNLTFDSATAAANYLGVDKSRIFHCINGRAKTVKGFHFKTVEED